MTEAELESDAVRLFRSVPKEERWYPNWYSCTEEYRESFRKLASACRRGVMIYHIPMHGEQKCLCGDALPCDVVLFLTEPPRGKRPE